MNTVTCYMIIAYDISLMTTYQFISFHITLYHIASSRHPDAGASRSSRTGRSPPSFTITFLKLYVKCFNKTP